MPGEKRFRTSLFGFGKSDVNSYIEKILREFDDKLKAKDEEIESQKEQLREVKNRYDELLSKADRINDDRAKIADVLIKAQEKAEIILEDARIEAIEEKKKLEELIESEKEKLVDIKRELNILKAEAVNALKKYESQLNGIIGNEESDIDEEKEENE